MDWQAAAAISDPSGGCPPAGRARAEGEGEVMPSDDPSGGPIDGNETLVDFDKPDVLRKWPSLQNQRRTDGAGPYLVVEATLERCIREFMAKPASMRHLYEIHTAPQPPLVSAVLSGEIVAELARLPGFSLIRGSPQATK